MEGRILVVDDDDGIRELVCKALEGKGCEVLSATNGKEALKHINGDPLDLIITDIVMPEADGIEVLIECRTKHPEIRRIAISGGGSHYQANDYLKMADALGADLTLQKPFELKELYAAVGDLLKK